MNMEDLSREDLYEKVWTMPGSKLSDEFGISDVAIAKRCRKLNVPRPPRGYWAKIEAGKRVKREPLPPTHEEVFVQEASKPVGESLKLPAESVPLHPLAAEFLRTAKSAKLSYDRKRVHVRERTIPEADISKEVALRAAMAFHVLLQIVEPRGINFRRSQSSYDGGHFRKGNDYLYFKIEEELVAKPATATGRRAYFATREENQVPCGRLSFTFKTERYGSSKPRSWTENEKASLETILAEMAKFICDRYVEAQKRREAEAIERKRQQVEWEIRRKKEQEEEILRKQEEAKRKHAKSLEVAARDRRDDLAKAAEWWRLYQTMIEFISECERRWLDAQEALSAEQERWLAWARETAEALSPFETGYPEPEVDGAFDPAEIPFGGPYPATRKFSQPPTMPEIPAPVVIKQGYESSSYQPPPKEPFPFWLKYQRS